MCGGCQYAGRGTEIVYRGTDLGSVSVECLAQRSQGCLQLLGLHRREDSHQFGVHVVERNGFGTVVHVDLVSVRQSRLALLIRTVHELHVDVAEERARNDAGHHVGGNLRRVIGLNLQLHNGFGGA